MTGRLLDEIRELTPGIRRSAARTEADGVIDQQTIDRLVDLGVFRLAMPVELGGRASDPQEMAVIFEELGWGDGSTGWCAMIGAITGMTLTFLPPETAAAMMKDERLVVAGVAAPGGQATVVPGGHRLSGRWSLASASRHATWLAAGARTPEGMRVFLLEAGTVTIHETWNSIGLRATGSHDFSVEDVFVPDEQTFDVTGPVRSEGSLSQYAVSSLGFGVAAVALGIARAATDEFSRFAIEKADPATGEPIAGQTSVQEVVAEAVSLHRSGMAYLLAEFAEAGTGDQRRAAQELACASATRQAARAVDLVYAAAGTSAVFSTNPLQRFFRDVHTAAQHGMVSQKVVARAGSVLLEQGNGSPGGTSRGPAIEGFDDQNSPTH